MGEDETISAEEFAKWVSAPVALERLQPISRSKAIAQIYERLRYGHLRACARRASSERETVEFSLIGIEAWKRAESGIGSSEVWTTGDFTIYVQTVSSGVYSSQRAVALFGVRFDPVGLEEFAPPPKAEESADDQAGTSAQEQEKNKNLPPVSPVHLAEWYELYRKAYAGAADTEPKAVASAQGCFPGKYVARQRVRDLRGVQKRGPKTPTSD